MKRRTHLFLLAIDEDPIPGAFDKDRIIVDVRTVISRSFISAYHPRVVDLVSVERDSNFMRDANLDLSAVIAKVSLDEGGDIDLAETTIVFSSPVRIEYKASENELLSENASEEVEE